MVASINGMAERFRGLLKGPEPIELPGCYDVLSAMIMQRSGFPAVFLSGYGVAASLLGNPDIGLTGLLETALVAKNVIGAISVPLVVDADNGYGNEDNVSRTVYEFEYAGVAAMAMEDQVLPKKCGHSEGKQVLPLPLYMRKLECALKARQTPMVIIARTDSPTLDDGIMRAKQFVSAGADAVIIDGLKSLEDVHRVAAEVPGPKQINLIYGGKTPLLSVDELAKLGFKIVLYSTPGLYAITRTLETWMKVLKEKRDLKAISDVSVTFGDFQKLIEGAYGQRPHRFAVGALGPVDDPRSQPAKK